MILEKERYQMFCEYINELNSIKHVPLLSERELHSLYYDYILDPNTKWIDICSRDSKGDVVGFLMIGYPPNCHPDADYYIEESYIKPKYRRQGYMKDFVSDFISKNTGIYCLFILKNNTPALSLWNKLFSELGYEYIELIDVGCSDEHCDQYGFRPMN